MKIASWNVNSIKVRADHVARWIEESDIDVLLMQEIKTEEGGFPAARFAELGYDAAVYGQKSYNGVAILSRRPIADVAKGLPGNAADEQARYIEATIAGVRVASIYLPNGNPIGGEKFDYKLAWMTRLAERAGALRQSEAPVVLGGDYNVIPMPMDVHDPEAWQDDALFHPESRRRWRTIVNRGWTDAFRALNPDREAYTFWDYQGGAWPKDNGIRIDHMLLSPQATDRLTACRIDRTPRGWQRASDHTPIVCEIETPS